MDNRSHLQGMDEQAGYFKEQVDQFLIAVVVMDTIVFHRL